MLSSMAGICAAVLEVAIGLAVAAVGAAAALGAAALGAAASLARRFCFGGIFDEDSEAQAVCGAVLCWGRGQTGVGWAELILNQTLVCHG